MSRIYEALQKAESERKTERGVQQQSPASPAPLQDEVAQEPHRWQTAVADRMEPETMLEDAPVVTSAALTRDLEGVRELPWAPLVNRLPALMERGSAVEQFRSLRSRLFELRDIKPLKSILITSGLPQEGKSFVASNLAISLARHKSSKVLLIDGDMRRYSLHEVFGTTSSPGLADYLAGRAEISDVMQRAQVQDKDRASALPNLTFIPGGNGGDKAADLSGNPRFAELIQSVSPYFDWIVVDSSPVLPVSDAVNLARACDGALLVARHGVTKFAVAQRAQSEMKAANVLGFVLNASDNPPDLNSYYGYGHSSS
ncbi:CpsD/CapB family tyrosine-protein kinase [Edaphobacter bradus]|uniref:CpsD/CapB family tyrosine-protein kinase n=1 Tax=Edaphobacter bradus TaxID=2259016 RepID=UPI0021DF79D4|nr:CpsD/CapB family tyrosine-protein kinase [Edaphobacter bradus]